MIYRRNGGQFNEEATRSCNNSHPTRIKIRGVTMRHLEHDMQVRFFHVVGIASNRYPRLKFIHAIPNGGKRHVRVAMKMKAEGVKRGVADVFVPLIGCGGQHGLYLEFKAGKNDLTPEQQEFRDFVEREGFV